MQCLSCSIDPTQDYGITYSLHPMSAYCSCYPLGTFSWTPRALYGQRRYKVYNIHNTHVYNIYNPIIILLYTSSILYNTIYTYWYNMYVWCMRAFLLLWIGLIFEDL